MGLFSRLDGKANLIDVPDEWFSIPQYAGMGLPGLPKQRALADKAKRDNWLGRPREKAQGGGWEYHYSSLPGPAQDAFLARIVKTVPVAQTEHLPSRIVDAAALKSYQRTTLEARAVILAEIDRLVIMGASQGKAIKTIVELAAAGELRPEVQAMVPVANARAGSGRTLTRATLYNWLKSRELGGAVQLAPVAKPALGIPAWAGAFMDLYARPHKPALTDVLEALPARLPEGVPMPSYDQARRFLKTLSAITKNKGRMGPRALKAMRAYVSRTVDELWPTAIYCADGHTFKAEVAHPIHGRPFRPEITSVIDVFSRRIVGWSVDLAENTWSVADAARHAFTTAGQCDIWYYDNGPGANNEIWDGPLTGLVARLGITKENSLPYNSQARGVIERLHSSVMHKAAKKLPTYIGADMDDEARQKAFRITRKDIKEAGKSDLLLSWPEFIELAQATVDRYNARPHDTLKKIVDPATGQRRNQSPNECWGEAMADGWQPDVLSEAEAADLFRPHIVRKTNRALVSLFGNEYFLPALEALHGQEVQVGYDIHDATKVWVRDLEGRLIGEAVWGGHKQSFFPVSAVEAAHEKRVQGRLKRIDAHRLEAEAERGIPTIDHDAGPVFTIEHLAEASAQIDAMIAPVAEAVPVVTAANGRPLFSSDEAWVQWLADHPQQMTPEDEKELRSKLRNSSFRLQLEWAGIGATTLDQLLNKATKVA